MHVRISSVGSATAGVGAATGGAGELGGGMLAATGVKLMWIIVLTLTLLAVGTALLRLAPKREE